MSVNFQDVDTPTMVKFKLPREVAEVEWGLTTPLLGIEHLPSCLSTKQRTLSSFGNEVFILCLKKKIVD